LIFRCERISLLGDGIAGTNSGINKSFKKAVNYVMVPRKSEKSAAKAFGMLRRTLRGHTHHVKDGKGVDKQFGEPRNLTDRTRKRKL
jgi:hypothetical protein